MEAFPLPGLTTRAGRIIAAVILVVLLSAIVRPATGEAASSGSPKAQAAALRVELSTLDRRRAALRATVRRTCRSGSAACRAHRARLKKANARAAKLRTALKPRTKAPATTTTTSTAPAATMPATASRPAPGAAPAAPAAAPAAAAPVTATAARVTYQPGVNVWHDQSYDIPAAQRLGARHVRVDFPAGAPVSALAPVIGNWAAHGIQVLPLATFTGTTPTADEARNLGEWARVLGQGGSYWQTHAGGAHAPALIEFGNETSQTWQYGDSFDAPSYTQRARAYGLRFRDAAQAIAAANPAVGLLAQADDYSGKWLTGVYAAVPNFHNYVAGWTTHPYGTYWRDTLRRAQESVARHGAPSTIPWDITEWGLSTDDGNCVQDNFGWNACMSYDEAATALRTTIASMRSALGSRLRTLQLYRVRDLRDPGTTNEREDYFGLQTLGLQDKGAYTAQARAELAAL